MAKTPLFQNWSWKRTLPEPFDKEDAVSTASYSKYCIGSTKKATLHSAALSAILAYMDMDTAVTPGSTSECAYGTQGEKLVAEYQSRTGEIHAVIFNKTNRKFVAGRFDIADPSANTKVYSIKDSGNTGTALFFALLPLALKDLEFKEQYDKLASCKQAGYPDMETADEAAYILCDNLYRRIENADNLGNDGIKIVVPPTGNIQQITPLNLTKGTYSPTSVLFGTFRIFKPGSSVAASIHIDKDHFSGKYSFSSRTFSPKEQMQIPKLEDWYIIPPEVDSICKHIQLTTAGTQPMRNFLLRGPAGTGKTYLAMAMAITAFRNDEVGRIILTRPAIEAGEKLGFLPGDLQSKIDPYLRPLYDALYQIMGAESFIKNSEKGLIEVAPLAYMRGRTLDNAFIILDEAQNTTPAQMKMFLTRIGFGSKVVITGDSTQKDLPSGMVSGLDIATKVVRNIDDITICNLSSKDVVRHPLVQKIVKAYEEFEQKKERPRDKRRK